MECVRNHTEMGEEVCEMVQGAVSMNLEEFYVGLYEKLVTYERNSVRNYEGLCGEVCRKNCVELYGEFSEEPVGTLRNYDRNCVTN